MKYIRKIAWWITKQYHFYTLPKFECELINEIPESIPERKILVVDEGNLPDSLVFKCPCGCHSTIILNLLKDAKPCWNYQINKRGEISILPSIWRKIGCRSHFFVKEGRIIWV